MPRARGEAIVTLDLAVHLPGVQPGDTHNLHFVGGGFLEEGEVVGHAHQRLPGKSHLGNDVLHLVLVGIVREDLDDLGDLPLGPEPSLLLLPVQRKAHSAEGLAVSGHCDRLLGLVELVAGGGGILLVVLEREHQRLIS